jgi:hypothetical protein
VTALEIYLDGDDVGTMVEWSAPGVRLAAWDELSYYAGGPLTFSLTSCSQPPPELLPAASMKSYQRNRADTTP